MPSLRVDEKLLPPEFVQGVAERLAPLKDDAGGSDVVAFPATLCAAERKLVHQIAKQAGLSSASTGEGASRYIQVFRSGAAGAPQAVSPEALSLGTGAAMSRKEKLSRLLSSVLRHRAEELGLQVRSDGFVQLEDLLQLRAFQKLECTELDVKALVEDCDKKRFSLAVEDDDRVWVRANQGHTIAVIHDAALLSPVLWAEDLYVCVHGTYLAHWESIRRTGLRDMGRNHIHFIPREPGEEVISGMRADVQVAVYVDAARAMANGCEFFWSANGVVLSRGFGGVIPPHYLVKAVILRDGLTWRKGTDLLAEQLAHDAASLKPKPQSIEAAARTVEAAAARSARLVPGSMTIHTRKLQDSSMKMRHSTPNEASSAETELRADGTPTADPKITPDSDEEEVLLVVPVMSGHALEE